jgi:radical SAM protein with 4Fe4S-binding SPASM domain
MTDEEIVKYTKDIFRNLPDFAVREIDELKLLQEITAGKNIEAVDLPRLYQIESTSKCNLACPFCPRTTDLVANGKRDMNSDMPLDKFIQILDAMPWIKSLELFHFGEPFMQKNLHEYIQACTDRGIYTVIASNLLPATNDKLDKAFAAGLKFLVMDVDSLDAEKYASMRINGRLDQLHSRVKYILAHPQRPYCIAQTIKLDGKEEYTQEEFEAWTGGLAADEIRYKFLDSFRGEIVEQKGTLGPDDICKEPFYGFTVHVNGNVVPCDRDWAGENVMGNLFEQSVKEIWQGEKYVEFRKQMKSSEKPAMCRKCPEGRLFNARSQEHIQVNMFKGLEVGI